MALGALNAPNAAFGALDAPNATLGRLGHGGSGRCRRSPPWQRVPTGSGDVLKDAFGALIALKASFSTPNALKASFSSRAPVL
ncbi:hypothetical protein GCM10023192_17160 [Amycolatopsis samaneae]